MNKILLGGLVLTLTLAGCATVSLSSTDVAPSWSSDPVRHDWFRGTSVHGVSVLETDHGFTPAHRVGGLFDGAYVSDATKVWSVTGPGGYQGRLEGVFRGVRFQGQVTDGRLKVLSADWSSSTVQYRLTDAGGTRESVPVAWASRFDASVRLGTLAVTPVFVGVSDAGVVDYRAAGRITGYRLADGDALAGYLDLGGRLLWPGADPEPALVALALVGPLGNPPPSPSTVEVGGVVIDVASGKLSFGP